MEKNELDLENNEKANLARASKILAFHPLRGNETYIYSYTHNRIKKV